jgi:N-acetylneuraminate synthase
MNNHHVYIIAEAGVNHNGSLEMAKELVDIAAKSGADAVKFQTFTAQALVSGQARKAVYQLQTTEKAETQFDMLKKLELDEAAHDELAVYCEQRKIEFLSTPFDKASLHLLVNKFHLPYIKISSGEITNVPFLLKIAQTGKKVILSTGMSLLGEIETALAVLAFGYLQLREQPSLEAFQHVYASEEGQKILQDKVILLHCTTEYPAPFFEVNLRVLDTLKQVFNLPVGYSDHTSGISVAIAAVARGAVLIEKHFTMDKQLPGPDHQASLEPSELYQMVRSIREVEQALGHSQKYPTLSEAKNIQIARKSLVAACTILRGEPFTEKNLDIKRPGTGLSPGYYWEWLGKCAERDYERDELIVP